jgi:hypothetical protein
MECNACGPSSTVLARRDSAAPSFDGPPKEGGASADCISSPCAGSETTANKVRRLSNQAPLVRDASDLSLRATDASYSSATVSPRLLVCRGRSSGCSRGTSDFQQTGKDSCPAPAAARSATDDHPSIRPWCTAPTRHQRAAEETNASAEETHKEIAPLLSPQRRARVSRRGPSLCRFSCLLSLRDSAMGSTSLASSWSSALLLGADSNWTPRR